MARRRARRLLQQLRQQLRLLHAGGRHQAPPKSPLYLTYTSATSPLHLPQVDVIKFLLYEQVKGLGLGLGVGLGSGLGLGLGLGIRLEQLGAASERDQRVEIRVVAHLVRVRV